MPANSSYTRNLEGTTALTVVFAKPPSQVAREEGKRAVHAQDIHSRQVQHGARADDPPRRSDSNHACFAQLFPHHPQQVRLRHWDYMRSCNNIPRTSCCQQNVDGIRVGSGRPDSIQILGPRIQRRQVNGLRCCQAVSPAGRATTPPLPASQPASSQQPPSSHPLKTAPVIANHPTHRSYNRQYYSHISTYSCCT